MTNQSKTDIGFGKKVRAIWLDLALNFVTDGVKFEDAKETLSESVAKDNPGAEAIQKVLTALNRIWFNPPGYCRETRDAAVELYQQSRHGRRLHFHWGMAVAAYPFVGSVAEAVGRLLRLQGVAPIRDVKRRVGEKFGDRDFVERVVRFDVSSFLDWGVLSSGEEKGRYTDVPPIRISDSRHSAWLIETLLHARSDGSLPLAQVRQHPLLFPFAFDVITSGVAISMANPRLQSIRHSQHEELISLRVN